MSFLIIPITVMLIRGALAVLILAGAESLFGDMLSARVRRALWLMCIVLMMIPQMSFDFQIFSIDISGYYERVLDVADKLPQGIAYWVGEEGVNGTIDEYSWALPGVTYHNYPYLLGMFLAIVPALFMLLYSYYRCRKKVKRFAKVTDERLLKIWQKITVNSRRTPQLLDSGADKHPPVLFGFFRQKLLLPVDALKLLPESDLELLLTHEYIHYRSWDGIINILTLCLWPFCWYNPFFLAARRRLRINCELSCDAEVLKRYPERAVEYGKLLLSFANTAKPPEVTMAFREYSRELRDRIVYQLELSHRKKSSWTVTFALAFILIAPFGLISVIASPAVPEIHAANPAPVWVVKNLNNMPWQKAELFNGNTFESLTDAELQKLADLESTLPDAITSESVIALCWGDHIQPGRYRLRHIASDKIEDIAPKQKIFIRLDDLRHQKILFEELIKMPVDR